VHDGTLVNGLLGRFPEMAGVGDPDRPGIVHRLDKGTSGLMVVARTQQAYDSLVDQLSSRSVSRRYLALVWGTPDTAQGLIDAPIGRSMRNATRMVVSARGKEARTRYEVLESFSDPVDVSLVECRLETGRTHQVRVHLSAIGHAVVGDDRYAGARQSLECPRPFLHAAMLGFAHPRSGEPCAFTSSLPDDIGSVLAGLRSSRPRDGRSS
jgi:23S rRNA pseudouridine1911/1915/1917 synthase